MSGKSQVRTGNMAEGTLNSHIFALRGIRGTQLDPWQMDCVLNPRVSAVIAWGPQLRSRGARSFFASGTLEFFYQNQ